MSAPADHDSLHESSPENVMSRIAEQILRNGDGRNAKKTGRLFISPLQGASRGTGASTLQRWKGPDPTAASSLPTWSARRASR